MKRKEKIKKYEELWIKIKDLIRSITNDDYDGYDELYMKIKFNSDGEVLLNKTNIPAIAIVVRAVFRESNEYYLQVLLDECLYEI